MADKRTQYRAEFVTKIGDRRIGRGETFWDDEIPDDTYVRWDLLLNRGHLTKVDEEPVDDEPEEQTLEVEETIPYNTPDETDESEDDDEEEPVGDDLALLTRDVLLERLEEEAGVTEDDIEGTGADGYITKQDALVRAREELE